MAALERTSDRGSDGPTLLPSMQFGRLFRVQPDGKAVFITSTGKLVCAHGECSSTICYWLCAENKAKEAGLPPPPRGGSRGLSTCDCQTTEGLNVQPSDPIRPFVNPASLFEFLEQHGAERVVIKGRDACRIPHLPGPTFVTEGGRLCCRHGASRHSLLKRQKAMAPSSRLPACGCNLRPLPVRTGIKRVELGRRKVDLVEAPVREG
jgi:hypothetical protein